MAQKQHSRESARTEHGHEMKKLGLLGDFSCLLAERVGMQEYAGYIMAYAVCM